MALPEPAMLSERLPAPHPGRPAMYDTFQAWALQNYGDSGKTKTVTRKKYHRIARILTGEEPPASDNSKFRFWVKAKGFWLGPPPPDDTSGQDQLLYVPSRHQVRPLNFVYTLPSLFSSSYSEMDISCCKLILQVFILIYSYIVVGKIF